MKRPVSIRVRYPKHISNEIQYSATLTHTYTYIHNNAVHRSLIALTALEIAIVSVEISNIKHYNDAINTHINMIL